MGQLILDYREDNARSRECGRLQTSGTLFAASDSRGEV